MSKSLVIPRARCQSCEASMIQGVFCHETGCPEAWKDKPVTCSECGFDFVPEERYQTVCTDCQFVEEITDDDDYFDDAQDDDREDVEDV